MSLFARILPLFIAAFAVNALAEQPLNAFRPDSRPVSRPEKPVEVSTRDEAAIQPRIIGGKESIPNAYPWMAALVFSDTSHLYYGQYGGGVLIHPYWILTAGHCVFGMDPEEIDVVLGAHDLNNPSGTEQRIRADELILHPDYNDFTLESDIALIRLSEPAAVRFSPLPLIDDPALADPETMARAIGWGALDNEGSYASKLMEVDVPIVDLATANASPLYGGTLSTNMLPAGYADGGKDAAPGDSGGPLTVAGADGIPRVLAGIVSFGPIDGSGLPEGYGVYAKVSQFRSFILSHILPGYHAWEIEHGLIGRYRDYDDDGRLNFAEYAFGCLPDVADAPAITIGMNNGNPVVEFRGPVINDAAYLLQYTDDLTEPFAPVLSSDMQTSMLKNPGSDPLVLLEHTGETGSTGFYLADAAVAEGVPSELRPLPVPSYAAHALTALDEPAAEDAGRYVKRYKIVGAPVGETLTLILRSDDFDAALKVYNARTGALLHEMDQDNAGGSDEVLEFIPQADTEYEVVVSQTTGNYMLAACNFNETHALAEGDVFRGGLSPSDAFSPDYLPQEYYMDEFLITVPTDSHIRVTMTSAEVDPFLSLYNGETKVYLDYNIGLTGNTYVEFFAKAGVRYLIHTSSDDERDIGTYEVWYDEYTPLYIAVGSTVNSELTESDPVDPGFSGIYYINDYVLTGETAGQPVTITLTSLVFDAYLYVLDLDDGSILREDDDSGGGLDSRITFTPEPGKNYAIRVSTIDYGAVGAYQLQVQ